jgi:hypothetical protein
MNITYRTDLGILHVEPTGSLEEQDFKDLAQEIDGLHKDDREFRGLLICTEEFPGYKTFADLLSHGEFIREHRDKVGKVAICTDSTIGDLAGTIGQHFTEADVKNFAYEEKDEAEKWILK